MKQHSTYTMPRAVKTIAAGLVSNELRSHWKRMMKDAELYARDMAIELEKKKKKNTTTE